MADSSEVPFKIAITDDALTLLKQKLALARFPDELDDAGWDYGAPLADIKRLVGRWQDGYDWRVQEAQLNVELPMFTRDIPVDGFGSLNIHYVHQKSELAAAIPLLFVHGWPGSFLEVRKILPLLTRVSEGNPSFHVVALSLPGAGFSEAPRKKGFSPPQYAEVCNKLMRALGYEEYVSQGGDWGHLIAKYDAFVNGPKHVKAWHTNGALPSPPSILRNPLQVLQYLLSWYSADEKAGLERTQNWMKNGQGYMEEQSTQPQTLGYSLADSPMGLLAWIYEKLVNWTDDYPWEDDEILTWISIYWFSRAGPAASIRIYYEVKHANLKLELARPGVPLGLSRFAKEIILLPRSWSSRVGNVVFETSHDNGGHFAAHEKPEELVGDLRKMFGKDGPAFGVVPRKSGYA